MGFASLGARPRIRMCRVPSAARADARQRDAGDAVALSRSANAADAHAPPEPFGRMRVFSDRLLARDLVGARIDIFGPH
jgi:hypothetical protein